MDHLGELFACVGARWSPRIGDPTALGWATTLAYLATALLAARAAQGAQGVGRRERYFWGMLALALGAMAINKELDLQSEFIALLNCEAKLGGRRHAGRGVRTLVVTGIAVSSAAMAVALAVWLRSEFGRVWVGILGAALLLSFVLIRAATFLNVGKLLDRRVAGLGLDWAFELFAIGVTALGAALTLRRR